MLHYPLSTLCASFSSFHLPASEALGRQSISKAAGSGTNLPGKEGDVPRWGERAGMIGQAVSMPFGKGTEGRRLLVAAAGGFVVGPLQSGSLGILEHLPH